MGVAEVKGAGAAVSSVDDGTQYYISKSGDTLSAIAKHFYGDANQYPKIFEAKREVIKDANLIFPGSEDPHSQGVRTPDTRHLMAQFPRLIRDPSLLERSER